MTNPALIIFNADAPTVEGYLRLGAALAASGDLYRQPGHASGLLLASQCAHVPPTPLTTGKQLASVIIDRLLLLVVKGGKAKGSRLPVAELTTMLGSEVFLQQFRPVDRVTRSPLFLGEDFRLTGPGYNDAGRGHRVLYTGGSPRVERSPDAINRFLDVMPFATEADRTNAVAGALTVMLRNHWPGGKPLLLATSTKSHGGKDTVILFASGSTLKVSISYESADWALQKAFVATVKHEPEVGVVNVENVRTDGKARQIRSAFLERFLTDSEPELYSPGTGEPVRRPNHLVVAMTTNFGSVEEDLMNRALPIHLAPVSDVAGRTPPIGNPKLEYLPANRERIEAELRGMVVRWAEAGRPLDEGARHPFSSWARVVGGILKAAGYGDFLGNCAVRRTADDPVRRGLGLLGAALPGQWATAADWCALAAHLGLTKVLIPEADRESPEGRRRGLGVMLSAHREETLVVETDDEVLALRLEKARRRFHEGKPETRYRFDVLRRSALPEG